MGSATLVGKLDDDVQSPRTSRGGMKTAPSIVVRHSRRHVVRETNIEVWFGLIALENVDEPLGSRHAVINAIRMPAVECWKYGEV
jgi:hypothetical protein